MEAKELRIGNYVKPLVGSEEHFGEITSLTTKYAWIDLVDDNYEEFLSVSHEIEINNLQPIPLTEEILLKCGFEYYGRITGWTIGNHSINNYIGKFVFYIEKNYEIEVEFLHQLQNLYFALTNEELTINL